MKSTTDIILAIAPVILNGALVILLIKNRREQIREEKRFKEHMEGIRKAFGDLKNERT